MDKSCTIYTDGSCWNANSEDSKRPASSFGVILNESSEYVTHSICVTNHGTSNIAELNAIINSVITARTFGYNNILIVTDSKYCIKVFTSLYYKDKNHIYRKIFDSIKSDIKYEFNHVPRNSNEYMEYADRISGELRKKIEPIFEAID